MQIKEILYNYEDFELAFLMEFKYQAYMPTTQRAIVDEVKRRGLTERDLESLKQAKSSKEYKADELRCPRCKSIKIAKEDVEFWNTYGRAGYGDEIAVLDGFQGKATYKKKLTCVVCDYVIFDPNAGGFIDMQVLIKKFISRIFKERK